MKKGMKITAAILVIALVAALICTAIEKKQPETQLTGKKWVPQWTGGGILKPIEPKDPREVQK